MDGSRSSAQIAAETGASASYVRALAQASGAPLTSQRRPRREPTGGSTHQPCTACGGATLVCDSRPALLGNLKSIRRRRRCVNCNHRFSTYELAAEVIEAFEARLAETEAMRNLARRLAVSVQIPEKERP